MAKCHNNIEKLLVHRSVDIYYWKFWGVPFQYCVNLYMQIVYDIEFSDATTFGFIQARISFSIIFEIVVSFNWDGPVINLSHV